MNSFSGRVCAAVVTAAMTSFAGAQIDSPGDGSDGDLNIGCCGTTTIDLANAITGSWDDPVDPENAGRGIYDPELWAVVFKYNSVSVSSRTLRFNNHPSGAPLVWLVEGDVTISSSNISVSAPSITPGPGGFGGGFGSTINVQARAGLGPGGGGFSESEGSSGGSYATAGGGINPGQVYGNNSVFPLIGGSGGSGQNVNGDGRDGGGGGGAFMIVAEGVFEISDSTISANGAWGDNAGGGSGGGIRILASEFRGTGTIQAYGGGTHSSNARAGGDGRIFIQTGNFGYTGEFQPEAALANLDTPVRIFPDADTPVVRSVTLNGDDVPSDPQPDFPEVIIDEPGSYQLVIETENIPSDGMVEVRVTPRRGAEFTTAAEFASGDTDLATWNATLDLPAGASAIQVRAALP